MTSLRNVLTAAGSEINSRYRKIGNVVRWTVGKKEGVETLTGENKKNKHPQVVVGEGQQ